MNYKKFFRLTLEFLDKHKPKTMTQGELYNYLLGEEIIDLSFDMIIKQLVITAQNYRGVKNFIGYFTRNQDKIKKALFDFDLDQCLQAYSSPEELYQGFIDAGCSMRKSQKSWKLYSRRIFNGLNFLNNFDNGNEFKEFIESYDNKEIECLHDFANFENKIFPFTLTADFLKELGFKNYSKPDVYIIRVMNIIESLERGYADVLPIHNEYSTFIKMKEIAKENEITDYFLDKLIWTICSGEFEGTLHHKINIEQEYYTMLHCDLPD